MFDSGCCELISLAVAGACNRQKVSGSTPSLRASRLQLGKPPSGILLDPATALRQNFTNRSKCTLHYYMAFSPTANPRPSTIRTTHAFGCPLLFSNPPLLPPASPDLFPDSLINPRLPYEILPFASDFLGSIVNYGGTRSSRLLHHCQ